MPERLSTYTVRWRGHDYAVRFGLIQLAVEDYRQRENLTYEQVADRTGIHRVTFWRLRLGRPVGPEVIQRVIESGLFSYQGQPLSAELVLRKAPSAPPLHELAGNLQPPAPHDRRRRDLGLVLLALLALALSTWYDAGAAARPLHATSFGLAFVPFLLAVFFVRRHLLALLVAAALLSRYLPAQLGGVGWAVAGVQATEAVLVAVLVPWLRLREERRRDQELGQAMDHSLLIDASAAAGACPAEGSG